jgi:hypothetical protein
MRWFLSALAAVVLSVAIATPAAAGGWATTLLDPLPDKLQAGSSYTVGFWILQHGSHVSQLGLTSPGLKFVDERGKSLIFKGAALPEGGHYATAMMLPHEGGWSIFGMQAPFADYKVGMVDLPGRVVIATVPAAIPFPEDPSWSTVKPPRVSGEALPPEKSVPAQPAALQQPAPRSAASSQPAPWAPFGIGVFVGLVVAIGAFALRLRSTGSGWTGRRSEPNPAAIKATTRTG